MTFLWCTWTKSLGHQDGASACIHLCKVLVKLKVNQIYLNLIKCKFGLEEVEFLGHYIDKANIWIDLAMIGAIQD